MKKENIALGIFLVFIVGAGVYFYTSQTVPQNVADVNPAVVHREPPRVVARPPKTTTLELSGKIDEHLTINNELRDVNFCGKTYKVKQVLIDGVDVIQRVAELVAKPENSKMKIFAENICKTVPFNPQLLIEGTDKFIASKENGGGTKYRLSVNIFQVAIDPTTYDIYEIDGYHGGLVGPIGKLK